MLVLMYAGAWTTSIGAGMVFLDWPLSNSSLMPQGWWSHQDMRAEHSHRLLGFFLGVGASVLLGLSKKGTMTRAVALAFLATVVFQALLGGARVLWDPLNRGKESEMVAYGFLILHALGAQMTLCVWVVMLRASSRRWTEGWVEVLKGEQLEKGKKALKWGCVLLGGIFLQTLLGALMRHADAGLAIPTFPKTPKGTWLPVEWSLPIALNWSHRLGALMVTVLALIFAYFAWRSGAFPKLRGAVLWLLALFSLQSILGMATIFSYRNPALASTHTLMGAVILALTCCVSVELWKLTQSSN